MTAASATNAKKPPTLDPAMMHFRGNWLTWVACGLRRALVGVRFGNTGIFEKSRGSTGLAQLAG
jgi:hypothetical protein